MKKILLAGIVILLAVFFVTCDGLFPEGASAEVEYTDVVYSEDGSQVTVYLDGIGVPKAPAQRAMSFGLAKMAYDYLEVIFVSGTTKARSQWELGESAGISGVPRNGSTGVNYNNSSADKAYMAVGTKDNKTLLGVGEIIKVDGLTGTTIKVDTKSVTFGLHSVQTGLKDGSGNPTDASMNSLAFSTTPTNTISADAVLSPLGDSDYPMFSIPKNNGTAVVTYTATYTFGGAAAAYKDVLLPAGTVLVEKRIPRYMYNGRYLIPRGRIDTYTEVTGTAADNVVTITFKVQPKKTGIFSFYVDLPVNLLLAYTPGEASDDPNKGTNGGDLQSVNWHLRTGFGSELYSLDDGLSSGGCVLMGVDIGALDWLDIQWEWED